MHGCISRRFLNPCPNCKSDFGLVNIPFSMVLVFYICSNCSSSYSIYTLHAIYLRMVAGVVPQPTFVGFRQLSEFFRCKLSAIITCDGLWRTIYQNSFVLQELTHCFCVRLSHIMQKHIFAEPIGHHQYVRVALCRS